jgi:ATP-dependent DNA helicase RecG
MTTEAFVSYAVGCMFGRYSPDKEGVILANKGETIKDFLAKVPAPSFIPDDDNIILVLEKRYRNRRIGDFLKELRLTEGKNTGFRKIRAAMKYNGSPKPVFITDEERVQFITRLLIHPDFKNEPITEPLNEPLNEPLKSDQIFEFIKLNPNCKRKDIEKNTKIPLGTLKRYLQELIGDGKIKKEGSDKTGGYVILGE